jgi:hypothetical protein
MERKTNKDLRNNFSFSRWYLVLLCGMGIFLLCLHGEIIKHEELHQRTFSGYNITSNIVYSEVLGLAYSGVCTTEKSADTYEDRRFVNLAQAMIEVISYKIDSLNFTILLSTVILCATLVLIRQNE